jgi:predicted AAA+ superfamily ATPase
MGHLWNEVYICPILRKQGMIERVLLSRLENRVDYKKAIILLGPRQTGKTTLAKALAARLNQPFEYFNADSAITRQLWTQENMAALRQSFGNAKLVILDEAQRIEDVGCAYRVLLL